MLAPFLNVNRSRTMIGDQFDAAQSVNIDHIADAYALYRIFHGFTYLN